MDVLTAFSFSSAKGRGIGDENEDDDADDGRGPLHKQAGLAQVYGVNQTLIRQLQLGDR